MSIFDQAKDLTCLIRSKSTQGTGFHYGQGYIITNSHVIGEKAKYLKDTTITFPNGTTISCDDVGFCFLFKITEKVGEVLDFAIFQVSGNLPPGITDLGIDFKDMKLPQYASLFCPHYGGDIDNDEGPWFSFELLKSVSTEYPYEIERENVTTESGASGAPIFFNDGKSLCLIGIHYSGNGKTAFGLYFKEIHKVLAEIRTFIAKQLYLETAKQLVNDPIIGSNAKDMIQNCMNKMC